VSEAHRALQKDYGGERLRQTPFFVFDVLGELPFLITRMKKQTGVFHG